MSKTLSTTKQAPSLQTMLMEAAPIIKSIAPKYVDVNRLHTLAIEAYKRPELAICTPVSVVEFCKKCAEWGTDRIGAGGVWPVAFGQSLTPIPDWRLLIHKAKIAGAITHARPDVIYSNEEYICERGLTPVLTHKQKFVDRGEPVAVYCVYTLPDGSKDYVTMDWNEVQHIKKKSKSKTGPWSTDEVEMAKKTVVKRTMKLFEGECPELASMLKTDNEVTGYMDIERTPVGMPVEIPQSEVQSEVKTTPQEPQDKPEKQKKAKKASTPAPDENNVVRGKIETVSIKETRKKGVNRYGIKIGEDWYGCFDKTLGEQAEELKGQEVALSFEENGQYKNVVDLWLEADPAEDGGGEADPADPAEDSDGDAEELVNKIQALQFNCTEDEFSKILMECGVNLDEGEAWEIADYTTLKKIKTAIEKG